MIGIDAVDVERLRDVMDRTARAEHRLFTPSERTYCLTKGDPVVHFAGTLAVKEAVIKAARLGSLLAWSRRIEVSRDGAGVPRVEIQGASHKRFEISISTMGRSRLRSRYLGSQGCLQPLRLFQRRTRRPSRMNNSRATLRLQRADVGCEGKGLFTSRLPSPGAIFRDAVVETT